MVIILTATVRASWSDAPCDFIQKNAHSVTASRPRPTKTTRQIPKPVRIGRSTARGGRFITSRLASTVAARLSPCHRQEGGAEEERQRQKGKARRRPSLEHAVHSFDNAGRGERRVPCAADCCADGFTHAKESEALAPAPEQDRQRDATEHCPEARRERLERRRSRCGALRNGKIPFPREQPEQQRTQREHQRRSFPNARGRHMQCDRRVG